jgi:AcrR family transcriptional regulator
MTDSEPATAPPQQEPEAGRAELRRAAFLKAARDVFLEFGYEQANMAEIVRRAGGSLSTLYAQFGGKKGLFEAMIDAGVDLVTQQMHVELAAHAPLNQGLRRIGEHFLALHASPQAIDVMRLMVSQVKKFPDMADAWNKRATEGIRNALAIYLEDRASAGEIKIANYEIAASVFLDLVRARIQLRALGVPSYVASEADIRESVDRAVKVFTGGIEALN